MRMNKPLRVIPVAENGRMNLPSDIRRRLGIKGKGEVVVEETEDGLRLTSHAERLARIRRIMKPYLGGPSMLDALIEERRKEASNDGVNG
jgi:AbrB family looped-hinge helix DNA binding protein